MTEKIWESKLDNIYQCEVTRKDEYKGVLKVTNTENDFVLLEEEVSLMYGAVYGPDMDDVLDWQEKIIQVVDNQ